jgi:hypothetical protein
VERYRLSAQRGKPRISYGENHVFSLFSSHYGLNPIFTAFKNDKYEQIQTYPERPSRAIEPDGKGVYSAPSKSQQMNQRVNDEYYSN